MSTPDGFGIQLPEEKENPIHLFYDSIAPDDISEAAEHSILAVDYFHSALSILA